MKLLEYEGKELFKRYGIATPRSVLIMRPDTLPTDWDACVLKAQVHSGDRFKHGGIILVSNEAEAQSALSKLWQHAIEGEAIESVLAEERIQSSGEHYISFSYSTETRGPVLSLAREGGSGVQKAHITPISIETGVTDDLLARALAEAGFKPGSIAPLSEVIQKVWTLFIAEDALIAEINPLFETAEGYYAGDAKIIIDDEKMPSAQKRIVSMDGDIAILASGGGASMLNIDALCRAGGAPANYTEYSGNPPAEVVKELTKRVLSREGLKGCWVVGAVANFTDLYTTLSGFVEGLREITPKPTYPIVIRRDGPRKEEAFEMLQRAKEEGFDLHIFGSEVSMAESAKTMVKLAYHP